MKQKRTSSNNKFCRSDKELCSIINGEIEHSLNEMAAEQNYVRLWRGDKVIHMPDLPKSVNPIADAIESGEINDPLRPYLGFSSLGTECARYLFYTFRWAYTRTITPRERRLLNRGHHEETILVADLEKAGMSVSHCLNEQVEVVGLMGHGKGHPDGEVIGVPGAKDTKHLLEAKTAADKYFRPIARLGIQEAEPVYYVQSQMYMKYRKLSRALFAVTNKNDESRHYERIHFDQDRADRAEERGLDVIISVVPPPKISPQKEFYKCRMCDARGVCQSHERPERNCRTCANSTVRNNGEWGCSLPSMPDRPVPEKFQRTGCRDGYRPLF